MKKRSWIMWAVCILNRVTDNIEKILEVYPNEESAKIEASKIITTNDAWIEIKKVRVTEL